MRLEFISGPEKQVLSGGENSHIRWMKLSCSSFSKVLLKADYTVAALKAVLNVTYSTFSALMSHHRLGIFCYKFKKVPILPRSHLGPVYPGAQ